MQKPKIKKLMARIHNTKLLPSFQRRDSAAIFERAWNEQKKDQCNQGQHNWGQNLAKMQL